MIDNLATRIGIIFLITGGVLMVIAILGLLFYFACCAWIDFSKRFRNICKAESLIFEYRRCKSEFMEWYREHKSMEQDGAENGN